MAWFLKLLRPQNPSPCQEYGPRHPAFSWSIPTKISTSSWESMNITNSIALLLKLSSCLDLDSNLRKPFLSSESCFCSHQSGFHLWFSGCSLNKMKTGSGWVKRECSILPLYVLCVWSWNVCNYCGPYRLKSTHVSVLPYNNDTISQV